MRTARDLGPVMTWLVAHPNLPVSSGVDIYTHDGAAASLTVIVDTPEQVQEWAEAMHVEPVVREHNGAQQHSAYTFAPFYINVLAIVRAEVAA